jgi:RNA recognition motif-containing protein
LLYFPPNKPDTTNVRFLIYRNSSQNQTGFAQASGVVLTHNASGKDRYEMKIYVGNLPFSMDNNALMELFQQHGEVEEATVVTDRDTGRSRGFGFVTMPDGGEANKAIEAINGQEVDGRDLKVNEARPKKKGGGGGGGGRRW